MWRIGIAFLIGHCCVHSLSVLPRLWPWAGLLAVGMVLAGVLRSVVLAALVCGFSLAWFHAHARLADDLAPELEGRDIVVVGHIASILDATNLDPQFEFDVEASDHAAPARLRLGWYDAQLRPNPGEKWRFVVRLKRRNGFANPGGFDYGGYLFRAAIGATGYIRSDERNVKLAPAAASYSVLRARAWLAQRIAAAAGETKMLGILQGLAVGDTQAMLPQQWQVFAATGTSHLMAISGLHISMVAALAALAGGLIARWSGAQRLRLTAIHGQSIAGITAAVGYSLLAGMSIPTQRTLVMLCIYFAARWARRTIGVGNALGWSLIAVLIIDPFAPMSIGAWLSFGAVATIIAATAGRLRADSKVVGFARVQWAVTIGLLPILAISFGSLSLISPIANALAVPLFTLVVVPLVLAGTALSCISLELGGLVLSLSVRLLESCWPAMEWFAELPLAMWYFPTMPLVHYALLALGAVLFVLPGAVPLRLVALALCLPAATYRVPAPGLGEFEIAMLDVGQGLAVVVRTHSHALVYDAGPAFRTGRDTGELVVLPYLRARGVRVLDRLVISHGDLDHQGGMRSILEQMPTRSLLVGPTVQTTRTAEQCKRGQRWVWDDVVFETLHPAESSASDSDNNRSCVLKVAGQGGSALLTGDIEAEAEAAVIRAGPLAADIVSIAHHGSRSSSTPEFVAAVGAKLALVSAGYRNRWNFPKQDVVQRWRERGAHVASTIDSGAIEIAVRRDGQMLVRHHRREQRRYWSAR